MVYRDHRNLTFDDAFRQSMLEIGHNLSETKFFHYIYPQL